MKHVLFVDDEPNILTGLRRTLRVYRDEWTIEFAGSGNEALERLDSHSFDAIVTDMRMPGMDGAQLLKQVAKSYPNTVRIVLSGQSDQESIQRSISRTHQYFSKPCDPAELYHAIERSCALRDQLSNPRLKELVSQTNSLPSLPDIYTKVMEELQSPDACVKTVAELIEQDVAMSTKLLQLVNSSFFGTRQRIESPLQAAALLGLNVLRPVVLSAGIFSQFDCAAIQSFSVTAFTQHCLAVGRAAARIAKHAGADKQVIEDSQMGGMVHDVGQLLLASRMSEDYKAILHEIRSDGRPACEVEMEHLGTDHANIGAHLLGLWGLPQPIVEAAAFHHMPCESFVDRFTPLTAVHVANVLVSEAKVPSPASALLEIDTDYLRQLGFADALPQWREFVHEMNPERCKA